VANNQVESAVAAVDLFLASLDADVNNPARGEWGIVLEAAGYRLDVGVAVRAQMLRAQAAVLPAGVIDPHQLLYWNRQAPFVSFSENRAGEVFVCGELPLESLTTETLDRFLGLLLASATRAREFAIENR
jgi:Putative bacterial sensory transduction regulator